MALLANTKLANTKLRAALIGVGAALLIACSPAFACKGKSLFSDDFREVDESWGTDAASVTVEDGRVKIKADPNSGYKILYPSTSFDNFDYCVTARMPNNLAATNPTGDATGGLLFWASDYANFFIFEVSANGMVAVERMTKSKWTTILNWRKAEGVNVGPGAKNRLRVTASNGSLTFTINETRVGTIKAPQPEGAGQVGLRAQSEKGKRDAWKFSDLLVTDAPQ